MRSVAVASAVALALLAPCACVHERLVWRLPDGSHDSGRLAQDVRACEEYTAVVEDEGPFRAPVGARAYGGWGNFTFERCMHVKGWVLTSVPTDRAGRGRRRGAAHRAEACPARSHLPRRHPPGAAPRADPRRLAPLRLRG